MIEQTLLACENLGGPKTHRLDFKRFHASVERTERQPDHVDQVVIKPDGIFAKINIPDDRPEDWQWGDLKVVVAKD